MGVITEKKDRICIYESGSGPVTVILKVSDYLAAGANFKLVYPTLNKEMEDFKMSAEDGSPASHILKLQHDDLNKTKLVWQILYFSNKPAVSTGKITIEISQLNRACKLTIPTSWEVTEIPPVQINRAASLSGSLTFMKKGAFSL